MMPFAFERAHNESEAIAAAAAGARFIAGGTTLVDLMREEVERPQRLVDINALPLRHVRLEGEELTIGALARMAEVAAHPEVVRRQPLIAEALLEGASPQLRNAASIGGNLLQRVRCPYFRMLDAPCNKRTPGAGCAAIGGFHATHAIFGTSDACIAAHPSDLAVALVALEASVRVRGPAGERSFDLEQLYRLPGERPDLEHSLAPGELIVEVRVPVRACSRAARYVKVRDRASYEFAVVSAAAALALTDGRIVEARVAAGGVGTRPWRLRACEQALVGRPCDPAVLIEAAGRSLEGARALPGNRYKLELLPATIARALALAAQAP